MLILCVKIFKTKSYSMAFKSKKVLSQVYDNYLLFRNTFQQKLVSYRNQFLLKGVFEHILKAIYLVGLIIIKIITVSCSKNLSMKINEALQSLLSWIK